MKKMLIIMLFIAATDCTFWQPKICAGVFGSNSEGDHISVCFTEAKTVGFYTFYDDVYTLKANFNLTKTSTWILIFMPFDFIFTNTSIIVGTVYYPYFSQFLILQPVIGQNVVAAKSPAAINWINYILDVSVKL